MEFHWPPLKGKYIKIAVGISKEQGGFDYLYIDFKMMNKCW
jgi:hypothetical protein